MYSAVIDRPTSFAHGRLPVATEMVDTIITEAMLVPRKCVRCAETYREFENIGAWRCSRHTEPFSDQRKVYPCCGVLSKVGCQACDHTDTRAAPYPGCETNFELLGGVAAKRLPYGNLQELQGVRLEAIQKPPDWTEQVRELNGREQRVSVWVYRLCKFGAPEQTSAV